MFPDELPDLTRLPPDEIEALHFVRWCRFSNETIRRLLHIRRHQDAPPFGEGNDGEMREL